MVFVETGVKRCFSPMVQSAIPTPKEGREIQLNSLAEMHFPTDLLLGGILCLLS